MPPGAREPKTLATETKRDESARPEKLEARAAAPGARDAIRSVSRSERRRLPCRAHAIRLVDRWMCTSCMYASAIEIQASGSTVPRPEDGRAHTTRVRLKNSARACAYLLLSFSPGNSGYSFASGGAAGSDMVGFAVAFTGGGAAFTGSGAGSGTDEGSGGVGSCCLESFPPIREWRMPVRRSAKYSTPGCFSLSKSACLPHLG